MKNIMLLVHDDAGQESRLQAALDVTRALDGHLDCLDVIDVPLVVSDYYTGGGGALMAEKVHADEARTCARLQRRLSSEDVPWTMTEVMGTTETALARAADFADLIVVSARAEAEEGDTIRVRPDPLPIKAHRPMLAVPPQCEGVNLHGNALIAWDGSHACNEALRCAIPLLRKAASVTMLEVNDPQGAFAMRDAATYLARHRVPVELEERTSEGGIADVILTYARHFESAFIVMGAYGKPRVAEALFGGVTRTMLSRSPVPLLLAH